MAYRMRPPVREMILEKNELRRDGSLEGQVDRDGLSGDRPGRVLFPVARAQTNIALLRREPAMTWSITRA